MGTIGGGILRIINHRHFWKAVILFALLVVGLRAWHYYRIQHDARAEQDTYQQLKRERLEFKLK